MARVLPDMVTNGSVITSVRPGATVRPGTTFDTRTAPRAEATADATAPTHVPARTRAAERTRAAVRPGTGLALRLQAAGTGGQLVLLAFLSATAGLGPAGWAAGTTMAVVTCALLARALRRSGASGMRPADRVTLTRAMLAGGVTALVADGLLGTGHPPVAFLVVLGAVALVLDGVDGKIARHTGTASETGARFDMEVDAFLVLVLSVHVAESLGAWVLVIGGMRYVFAAAGQVAPWLRGALPPSFARKTVAALQGIVLVVAGSGILPWAGAVAVVAAALAALVWSFTRDTVWLYRTGSAAAR